MKQLWQLINREMRKDGLTGKQMAARLRMDPAHLSRLRTGQLRDLSRESLKYLLLGIGASPTLRTEVLTAYLIDKLSGGKPIISEVANIFSEAVGKAGGGSTVAEEAPDYGHTPATAIAERCTEEGLNRRVAAAIGNLAEAALDSRRLQMLLISLAKFARKD